MRAKGTPFPPPPPTLVLAGFLFSANFFSSCLDRCRSSLEKHNCLILIRV